MPLPHIPVLRFGQSYESLDKAQLTSVRTGEPVALGLQEERLEGARVFVLPNPSGRNANFSYEEMLAAFKSLRRVLR